MAFQQWLSIDVKERIKTGAPIQIVDVREPYEFENGHIPGAKLIPLGQLQTRVSEIVKSAETVVVCHSGGRSSVACDFLDQLGYQNIRNLMGGMSAWDGQVEY